MCLRRLLRHSFKLLIVKVCNKLCSSFTCTGMILCVCSDLSSANTSLLWLLRDLIAHHMLLWFTLYRFNGYEPKIEKTETTLDQYELSYHRLLFGTTRVSGFEEKLS